MHLSSTLLSKWGFSHGFSTRRGGVSKAPYDASDFALLRDPEALRENLARLGRAIGFDPARLYQVMQVHGATVREADGEPSAVQALEGDAVVARRAGHAAGVRVADCVPILVGDVETRVAVAVHAGWKGVVAGVIEAGVRALGAPGRRVAAIGPCIGPCCFEVGADVAASIAEAAGDPGVVVRRHEDAGRPKAMVDLRRAARARLRAEGLADVDVDDVGGCTRCDPGLYYSFRRDGDASGRLLAVVVAGVAGGFVDRGAG